MKKHGISLEKLEDETEKLEDKYLKTKLEDIKLIYEMCIRDSPRPLPWQGSALSTELFPHN